MSNLINSLWQGIAVTALIWLLLKLLPRLSSATRYGIWWITLLAVALLPLRTFVDRQTSDTPRPEALSKSDSPTTLVLKAPRAPGEYLLITQPLPAAPAAPIAEVSAPTRWLPLQLPSHLVTRAIVAIWCILSLVFLIRLAVSYRTLRHLKRTGAAPSEALRDRFVRLAESAGLHRSARLLVSHKISAPLALGFLDCAILIPPSLADESSPQEFDHIMLHELSHLSRFDDWTNLLEHFLIALLPIQPALFWIGRNLDLEREAACDDRVVANAASAKPYATSLTRIAELALFSRHGVLATAALATGVASNRSQLYRRINRLLDRRANKTAGIATVPLLATLIMIALLFSYARSAPELIALTEAAPAGSQSPANNDATTSTPTVPDMPSTTIPATPGTQIHTIPAQPGEKLVIDVDLGNIQIVSSSENQVRFKITQTGRDIANFLRHHRITIGRQGHEVSLRATGDPNTSTGDVDIEYEIAVPAKFDLDLKNSAGNTDLSNLNGTLSSSIQAGNIDASACAGTLDLATRAGNIDLSAITATGHVVATNGNIDASNCSSALDLAAINGNIDLSKMSADVHAKTTNGNVEARASSGALDASTKAGNIDIHKFTGPSVNAHAQMGNIDADIDSAPKSASSFMADMGNVGVNLVRSAAIHLKISASMGDVDSQFPSGNINGGGPEFQVSSKMGNVALHSK